MKFTQSTHSTLTVRQISKGAIRIGDEKITENVILFRDEIKRDHGLIRAVDLNEGMIEDLVAKQPEIIIFGCGFKPIIPPKNLIFALARKGIGFECMDTPAACRTFNILISEDRDAAANLILP